MTFTGTAIVAALALTGMIFLSTGDYGIVAMIAIFMTAALLCWQFYTSAAFWETSVAEDQGSEV